MLLRADRFEVDPDEVDQVVNTLFSQIDEFGSLCREFGQLVPPMAAFGLIGSPAGLASMTAHELLQRAQRALELVLNRAADNVKTAMIRYRGADGGGASALGRVPAALPAVSGLLQRLQSTGMDAGGIHSYLQHHGNQIGAGVAEVHVGRDLSEVRLRPGDLVTTSDFTATVGPDGRLYANGQPVQAAAGIEARVYRGMPTGPATG